MVFLRRLKQCPYLLFRIKYLLVGAYMLSFAIKHRNIIDLCVSIPASMFVNMV